jgi:phage terminase large subunit GpA-like protein
VSEWADKHRILSSEASAEPGQWRTSRVPYARAWMDVFNDPYVHTVVLKTSSQVGKSETLNNVLGYFIHHDPCPIMMVQPTIDRMKEYSKKRIAPMIRDTPALSSVVSKELSRDSDNTTLGKSFIGGHLKMVGANAASALASDPIRVLLADEVDRYPKDVDGEGDPLSLAVVRQTTFTNRKAGITSTPTTKGQSRVEEEYTRSHQFKYHVPCPQCGEMQTLQWKDSDNQYRLVWENTPEGVVLSIHYACVNGCAIEPHNKLRMLDDGDWLDNEGRSIWDVLTEKHHNGNIGFEISALYSVWLGWNELAERFIKATREAKAGKPELLKTFVNTMLGETWDLANERPDVEGLEKRAEEYETDVPLGVLLLTAGVDTQPNRLECSVWGWGVDGECWLIYHEIFWGDTSKQQVWNELEEFLLEGFKCERRDANGERLVRTIDAACIDAGGHNAEDVKNFTKRHRGNKWLAIFGRATGAKEAIVTKPTRVQGGALLWAVGPNLIKDKIFSQMKVDEPGPGYMHFPKQFDDDGKETANEEYFKQLTAEKKVRKQKKFDPKDPYGHSQYLYKKIRERNETLDCLVYAFAAKEHLKPNFPALLKKENLHCAPKSHTLYDVDPEPKKFRPTKIARQVNNQGGFVSSWSKK